VSGGDERLHELLGKHLLGRATPDDLRELNERREVDAAFRAAMDSVERHAADFRRSAAGEPAGASSSDLPDWLRPTELARGLEGWFWRWLVMTLGATAAINSLLCMAAVRIAPDDDPSRIERVVYRTGAITFVVLAVAAWRRRERLAAAISSGGPGWERAVAEVREQERRYLSQRAGAALATFAALTATGFVAAASLPRQESGFALLAAAVSLALTLRITKRRALLRGLAGDRRILR
jgi:hypothetical protein